MHKVNIILPLNTTETLSHNLFILLLENLHTVLRTLNVKELFLYRQFIEIEIIDLNVTSQPKYHDAKSKLHHHII